MDEDGKPQKDIHMQQVFADVDPDEVFKAFKDEMEKQAALPIPILTDMVGGSSLQLDADGRPAGMSALEERIRVLEDYVLSLPGREGLPRVHDSIQAQRAKRVEGSLKKDPG